MSLCAAAVVPSTPRVQPVNVVDDLCVYLIFSLLIVMRPFNSGKPLVEPTVIVVALSLNDPLNVVVLGDPLLSG